MRNTLAVLAVSLLAMTSPGFAQTTPSPMSAPAATQPAPSVTPTANPEGDLRDLPEIVAVPRDMTVKIMNEGGKYVVRDFKKLAKGDTCKVFQSDLLVRDGAGVSSPGAVLVRYMIVAQTATGGCPMGAQFELSASDYKAAQQSLAASYARQKHAKK